MIALTLSRLLTRFRGLVQFAILAAIAGLAGYVAFMATVDVPMYLARWHTETAAGQEFFGLLGGLHDVATRWVVTHDIDRWKNEIAWMSLYFSLAVWTSLILAGFGLVKHLLPRYRVDAANSHLANRRPASLPVAR